MLDKETEIVRYKMQTGLINKKQGQISLVFLF